MPSVRPPKKTSKASTLTIRIDERLKYDVIAIARESGEDVSTWIRRFFEGIRTRKGLGQTSQGTGDDEGEPSHRRQDQRGHRRGMKFLARQHQQHEVQERAAARHHHKRRRDHPDLPLQIGKVEQQPHRQEEDEEQDEEGGESEFISKLLQAQVSVFMCVRERVGVIIMIMCII